MSGLSEDVVGGGWVAHYCAPSRGKADGFVSLFDGARDGLTHTPVNSGNGIGTGGVGARGNIWEWYYVPYLVLLVGTRERVITLTRSDLPGGRSLFVALANNPRGALLTLRSR